MFEVAEAYEVMMGRWSRQLAPLFVEFVGVRDGEKVLDVGCGTGSLSATLARVTGASEDRRHRSFQRLYRICSNSNRRSTGNFEVGDAQNLPYPDASFDRCLALLAVDYIPDAPKAAQEMRRVTKTAGVVATTMWDRSRDNELDGCFWDAAISDRSDSETDCRETGIVRFCRSAFRTLDRCWFDRHRSYRLDNALPFLFV